MADLMFKSDDRKNKDLTPFPFIMIKRLQVNFLTNRIKIISDNPKYDAAEVEQEKILINGKVIGYGRELER
jgi:hypothetical protein